MGRGEHRRAVGAPSLEGHLHRPEAGDVSPREDAQDAGRSRRVDGVKIANAGVRVDRAHKDGVRLTRQADVVVEAPLAAHEASILEAPDRLADPELSHEAVVTHFEDGWSSEAATSLEHMRIKMQLP